MRETYYLNCLLVCCLNWKTGWRIFLDISKPTILKKSNNPAHAAKSSSETPRLSWTAVFAGWIIFYITPLCIAFCYNRGESCLRELKTSTSLQSSSLSNPPNFDAIVAQVFVTDRRNHRLWWTLMQRTASLLYSLCSLFTAHLVLKLTY